MAKSKGISSRLKKEGEFIPPDGGWGWLIILAAGLSNLSALPMLQQFGLLFRDRLAHVGVTGSALTTIINMNSALTSCVGLANGPVFKTFSYRAVALTGAIVVFISLLLTTFSYNFATYLISFSILYGAGYGILSSASALALNTYWKKRRRLATGLSWTTTGLGPILWPQIFKFFLFPTFGPRGTTLFLSGFSLHAIACALLLQPVEWHSKKPKPNENEEEKPLEPSIKNIKLEDENKKESGYFSQKLKNFSAFSSQYLYNEDDPLNRGYEITDPGIPMMIRANDGYFSQSRQSLRSRLQSREGSTKTSRLNSKKPSMTNLAESRSRKSSTLYLNESKKNSSANLGALGYDRDPTKKQNLTNLLENKSKKSSTLYLNESKKNSAANLGAMAQEREGYKPIRKISITDIQIPESEIEDCPTLKAPQDLKADEKAVLEKIDPEKEKLLHDRAEKHLANSKNIKTLKVPNETPYGELYNRNNHSNISFKIPEDSDERKYLKDNHSNQSYRTTRQRRKSNNFNYESEVLKQASLKLEQYLKEKDEETDQKLMRLMSTDLDDDVFDADDFKSQIKEEDDDEEIPLTFCQKVAIFFDLDLLKDFTFINLMLGITLANFNELNFSILTPFILGKYGLTPAETSDFMSILGGIDVGVRFCIPFVAGKIGWDNNSFFLFGVMSMAMGRVVLTLSQKYWSVMLVACLIGFGKGLRTVFMALVIPTHVPLHKLPGASGIQLLSAGIAYIALGPIVGWIYENAPTEVTLHCLNIFTILTAISWGLEKYIRSKRRNESNEELVAA